MTIEELAVNLARRMREIDEHITTSAYRALKPGEQDECPTGDDFGAAGIRIDPHNATPPMTCPACAGKRYLVSDRSDGYTAIEACDGCSIVLSDATAAQLAEQDGIAALHDYPCYVIGRIVRCS